MTPKEKAIELIEHFYKTMPLIEKCSWCSCDGKCKKAIQSAKEFAIFTIEQIKLETNRYASNDFRLERLDFLDKVKKEIETVVTKKL